MTKEKSQSKAGGQRYLAIKGHARPMFNLLYFRRFTFTGYFVAVAGIEPATPPSWVVASFLSAGDCGIRTRACHRHGIPYIVILLRSPPPYKPHSRFGQLVFFQMFMARPSQHTSLGLTLLPILLWFTAMSSLSILRPTREPSGFGTSPLHGGSTHGPLSCRLFPRPPTLGLFRCRFGLFASVSICHYLPGLPLHVPRRSGR